MFSRIRKRFTYTNVAMTIALVFAMTGGAFAAGKILISSTKQISPKVLKQLAGKKGPAGAAGANGLPGAAGKEGAVGKEGQAGKEGAPGKEGKTGGPGESVSAKEVKVGENACGKNGGGEFKVGATTTFACNGSPWTAGGTLPAGASEHGTWTFSGDHKTGDDIVAGISFPVPLANALEATQVHYIGSGEPTPAGCGNGTFEKPEAESGNLCVYESIDGTALGLGGLLNAGVRVHNPEKNGEEGAGISGSWLFAAPNFKSPATEGDVLAVGDWVVTG